MYILTYIKQKLNHSVPHTKHFSIIQKYIPSKNNIKPIFLILQLKNIFITKRLHSLTT